MTKELINTEEVAMEIIAYSGDARSSAFEAIKNARSKDFDLAQMALDKAKESSLKAHQAQTRLLVSEAKHFKNDINILLIHAQDHLMTSKLAIELIEEMIFLHKGEKY